VNPDDVVLVRIYGKKSELLIDREQEIKATTVLHINGCAAPIFCRFENGIAYGFVSGTMVNLDLAQKPEIQRYCFFVLGLLLIVVFIYLRPFVSLKVNFILLSSIMGLFLHIA